MHLAATAIACPSRIISFLLAILTLGVFSHTKGVWYDCHADLCHSRAFGGDLTDHQIRLESYLKQVINDHGLAARTQWLSWRIHSKMQASSQQPSVIKTNERFYPHRPEVIDIRLERNAMSGANSMMKLPVAASPRPGHFNAAEFLFAVSTNYGRLMANNRAIPRSWQRWLTQFPQSRSNGAHLVVLLDEATNEEVLDTEAMLKSLSIEGVVYTTGEPLSKATRYLGLVEEMRAFGGGLAATNKAKKWFVLVEDSVFFPSLAYLGEKLSQSGVEESSYVTISNKKPKEVHRGELIDGHGGGAVFLAKRAVDVILSPSCFGEATSHSPFRAQQWDSLLEDCLVNEGGLTKIDLSATERPLIKQDKDKSKSFTRPLLIHHQRPHQQEEINLNQAYIVADACGELCFMQEYLFQDAWVLINGVSIHHYPQLPKSQWHKKQSELLGPETRPLQADQVILEAGDRLEGTSHSPNGQEIIWEVMDTKKDEHGNVWQAYVRRAPRGSDEVDTVIVLVWHEYSRLRQ